MIGAGRRYRGQRWCPEGMPVARLKDDPQSRNHHDARSPPCPRRRRRRRLRCHPLVRPDQGRLRPQLGARRRPRALLLRQEDGLVQGRRHRPQHRAGQGLGGGGAEGRRRRQPDRPGRHAQRADAARQGRRYGRRVQRLRQLAAGPLLAEELGHQVGEGPRRQEDRQPRRRRRAHHLAGAGQGQRHGPGLGDLGQHRRQRQARVAEVEVDRRDHLVLQHPPHLPARARRRHGLRRLEGRRPQHLRQHHHRQRRLPEEEQGRPSPPSSRSRRRRSPPASRRPRRACRR